MLVSSLMAVVLLIVTSTLASTLRWTRLESQRGFAMSQMLSVLARVESLLQRSCNAGVAYLPPASGTSGLLAMHLQEAVPFITTPLWEDHWVCLIWNPRSRQLHQFSGRLAARTQLPQLPTPAQLNQLATGSERRNLLASDVSDLTTLCNQARSCKSASSSRSTSVRCSQKGSKCLGNSPLGIAYEARLLVD